MDRKIIEYTIVKSTSREDFIKQVNEKIKEWFQPRWRMDELIYCREMVKYEEQE